MTSSQSMDMSAEEHTDHSDKMSTPTPTPRSSTNNTKSYAFAVNSSQANLFTYTQNGQPGGKLFKSTSANTTNINGKKRKTAGSPPKSREQPEKPNPNTDTEEEDLNTTYKAAKKAL